MGLLTFLSPCPCLSFPLNFYYKFSSSTRLKFTSDDLTFIYIQNDLL
jgi:hypothetical protein